MSTGCPFFPVCCVLLRPPGPPRGALIEPALGSQLTEMKDSFLLSCSQPSEPRSTNPPRLPAWLSGSSHSDQLREAGVTGGVWSHLLAVKENQVA